MTTRNCHEVVGDDGIGKCSVPMWASGVPAGFSLAGCLSLMGVR